MDIEKIARLGYATKGIVYGIVAILALLAAFTTGGKTTGTKGALHTIAQQPFGQILLVLVGVGLAAYALWRFVEVIQDPEHKGDDSKGLATRAGYAISGLTYAGLAVNAIAIAFSLGSSNSDSSAAQKWTRWLLSQPFGQWLVGIGGAILIGVGFYKLYKAYRIKFRQKLWLGELNPDQQKTIVNVCRFGIAARGVVFVLFGFFLLQAAYQSDASEARSLDGVLQTLAAQPYGKLLLGIVAFGLLAYAVYMLVQSRYRQFPV